MLGLIIFPWEAAVLDEAKDAKLSTLAADGWPQFTFVKGGCENLYDLIHRLRNAVAHNHITFSSDSRVPKEVEVTFEDWKNGQPHWMAIVNGEDLSEFCLRFTGFVEMVVG
jgi:hypothetical protein